MHLLNKL